MAARFPVITYTKIDRFETCRKWYWFDYLSGRDKPPEKERTPANVVGNGVHESLKKLCHTGEPDDARDHLDAYLRMPLHECAGPGTDAHNEAFEILERGIAAHQSIESENRWAERRYEADAGRFGVSVMAYIDRVDRLPGGHWQLIDWKTGRWDEGTKTDQQLDIYHVLLRAHYRDEGVGKDSEVTTIAWNLRSGNKRMRILTKQDAIATLRYLGGIATRLRELREFEANPGNHCGFCPWRDQCPEAANVPNLDEWLEDEPDDAVLAEAASEAQ